MRARSDWPDWRQWQRLLDWPGAPVAVRRRLKVGLPEAFWRPSRPRVKVVVRHVSEEPVARVVWAQTPVLRPLRGRMRRPVWIGLFHRVRPPKWGPRGWGHRSEVVQGSKVHRSSSRHCVRQSLALHEEGRPRPRRDRPPLNRYRRLDPTVGWIPVLRRWRLPRVLRRLVPRSPQPPARQLRPRPAREPPRSLENLRRAGFGQPQDECSSPLSPARPKG